MKLQAPTAKLNEAIRNKEYIGAEPSLKTLDFLGVFILPGFLEHPLVDKLLTLCKSDENNKAVPFHPTRVESANDDILNTLLSSDKLMRLFESGIFFGGNVAVYRPVIFRKDKDNAKTVQLHSDLNYMMGTSERYSFFFALTEAKNSNGGLIVYPGTHHYGLLSDAGEINAKILPDDYPMLATDMKPGDVFIMNSATWHMSNPNEDKTDRVYLEMNIQHADDPTSHKIVSGHSKSEWKNPLTAEEIFLNSRVQRLKAFYNNASKGV
ncbi:MAG TPA: phytanoyl-CoA dioxygenase family protein [Rickettsiales bacterium]|nr:phytanoyl-CoA dioxygenase family protein [Rickettsiales bacterium]